MSHVSVSLVIYEAIYLQVKDRYVIKSGTDFRNMSKLTLIQNSNHTWDVSVERVDLTSSIPEDAHMKKLVSDKLGQYSFFFS